MRKIYKIFKVILIGTIVLIGSIIVLATLFIKISPEFGGKPTSEQKSKYAESGHYEDGKFTNEIQTTMDADFFSFIKKMMNPSPKRKPSKEVEVKKIDSLDVVNYSDEGTRLTWFGHSAFLLEMNGKKILLDPMFGDVPAPHPWLGPSRYSKELPMEVKKIPFIDFVIFSHDHYDHLDYGSIQRLKDKVGEFYTPLGVGNHLKAWGVNSENIHEFNWWENTIIKEIELICTPARHFSGRGLTDRSATLWASWVIKGKNDNIYFSGDSGYGPHFKEIGEQYGPFDISMMECGQYNEDWKAIHMMPEETAKAGLDLKSKLIMPIHWGAFTLAFHDWTDPIERVTKKATELGLPITTPKIGEAFEIGDSNYPQEKWWLNY